MPEVVVSVLSLIAGIGIVLFGMKFMSDGLERSAGKGMRKLLGKVSNNRFAGVGIGAAVTAIIQSSAATTVMVIGFVNAGLMTLFQAAAIIMGANIGTTVTAFLASLSAFKLNAIFGAFAFVGAAMVLFIKKEKVKQIGYILGGFGLMFIGLEAMSSAFATPEVNEFIRTVFTSIDFPLLLIIVGMLFTALVQSSSAVTTILVSMVGAGALSLKLSLFIVLGSNIGTCVSAILSAMGANTNAKRTAMMHLIIKVVGTLIFMAIVWPLSDYIVKFLELCFPDKPEFQVAFFHFLFNIINTAIFLPLINPIVKLATKLIPDKRGEKDETPHMYYVDERFLQTPPIAVAQVKREVDHMGEMSKNNLKRAMSAVLTLDVSEIDSIMRDEDKINFINKGLAKYLIKLSSQSLTRNDEKFVGSLFHVISDIERIADYAKNFIEEAKEMSENDISFTQDALDELEDMYDKVMTMYDEAMYIFENNAVDRLNDFSKREEEVDMTKRLLGNNHIKRLNAGGCTVESGTHFYSMISALERIADHLTNIAFSIKSPSGSQREAMEKIEQEQKRRTHERKKSGSSLQVKPDEKPQPEVAKNGAATPDGKTPAANGEQLS